MPIHIRSCLPVSDSSSRYSACVSVGCSDAHLPPSFSCTLSAEHPLLSCMERPGHIGRPQMRLSGALRALDAERVAFVPTTPWYSAHNAARIQKMTPTIAAGLGSAGHILLPVACGLDQRLFVPVRTTAALSVRKYSSAFPVIRPYVRLCPQW